MRRDDLERPTASSGGHCLTEQGWARLDPVVTGAEPGTCFVAMASNTVDTVYDEGIRAAVVTDCGFTVTLVERIEHNQNINDVIIAELRRCQFMVADFTGHRNGVYFEAGYVHALGREVIFTCRADDFHDKVHFDTRPYNHIRWQKAADLRDQLTARIRATVQGARLSN